MGGSPYRGCNRAESPSPDLPQSALPPSAEGRPSEWERGWGEVKNESPVLPFFNILVSFG
jgi:hypothetical protein